MRNVIFDLGGVVFDWNPDAILAGCYADPGLRATLKAAVFQHEDWLLMDRGVLTEADAIARFESRTGRSTQELAKLLDAVRDSLKPKSDTVALIERLSQRGVPLYCLSNMPAATFAHLKQRHDFWPAFRGIVISGEIQLMKPEPQIFEYLLRRYDIDPADTVFVDDHEPNVDAARALGMQALRFYHAQQCEQELEPMLRWER